MTTIAIIIEVCPEFRIDSVRVALGDKPLTSPLEAIKYSTVCSYIELNRDWLMVVNNLGYTVT